ncbi:stigma-specific STIG1-like protein 1 [Aristolochia californica]|uniref:stigma-specific STIG1-like protein 1 n=1 Tax=Aristolochia californica TaxID=171875 RepID=UPI0035DA9FA5
MKMMPIVRCFFLAAVVLSLSHARTISASEEGSQHTAADLSSVTLRGVTRSLAGKATVTCNQYPQICRNMGSPGPDCCRKQCVDVMTDRLNCGQCGYKCKYAAACCGGRCVNFANDEKNCGSCYKRCSNGDICVHGLCNYA